MKLSSQGCLKLSNQGCMSLTNQGCLLPLLRRRVSGKGQPVRINGDDEDDELEATENIMSIPKKEQLESAKHNKSTSPKRINFRQKTTSFVLSDDSARLTLAKLFAILGDAYVCTMMSFATKGGLGAVTMGGNINLPSSVPAPPAVKPVILSR